MPSAAAVTRPIIVKETGSINMPHFSTASPARSQSMLKGKAYWPVNDFCPNQSPNTKKKSAKLTAMDPVAAMAVQLGNRRPSVAMKAKAIAGSDGMSQAHSIIAEPPSAVSALLSPFPPSCL